MNDTDKFSSFTEQLFKVIALTVSDSDKYQDCSVIETDAVHDAAHSQVFGPGSLEECGKWLRENCECSEEYTVRKASYKKVDNI